MRFNPVSEEDAEAQSSNIWAAGCYDYEVKEATETESKAGNEMIALELWIFDKQGNRRMIFDYLVSSEKAQWKLRSFAASCGLLEQYETGSLMASEMVGRSGKCDIIVQKETGEFPAKNSVKGYVKAVAARTHQRPTSPRVPLPAGDIDDEVPF